MPFPHISISKQQALSFDVMKQIDYHAIKAYDLPIILMMENAGYHLARITAMSAHKNDKICIGVGKGNNAGGGLVAARRLKAWGYHVFLDVVETELNPLAAEQLQRALAFGVSVKKIADPDIFIDAYFGFSQRFPLPKKYIERIKQINGNKALKISLDVPTGLPESLNETAIYLQSDIIVSLAYPKKVLYHPTLSASIYVVDIGIPKQAFLDFEVSMPIPFEKSGVYRLVQV